MPINYPSSIDSFSNPSSTTKRDDPWMELDVVISNLNDATEALETKVWITGSTDVTSHEYKINELRKWTTKGDLWVFDGTNYQRLPAWTNGHMLVADSSEALWVKYTSPSAWGTVTTASITSANGFAWSVANPTTTPAITLSTTVTGMLKGNWTAISAATPWTDYYQPTWTDVAVTDGGTWISSATAYAPLCWGTTSTWAFQSVSSAGLSWQVLTSNGASALPTFQAVPTSFIYKSATTVSKANYTGAWSAAYSITIPWGTIASWKWIKITIPFYTQIWWFNDYRDDNVIRVDLWWTTISSTYIIANRAGTSAWWHRVFEMFILWTWSAAQDISMYMPTVWNAYKSTTTIDTTSDTTLAIYAGFEYASVNVKTDFYTLTVEKL